MIRRFSGLMAAVVFLATAVIGLAPSPAEAAYCSGSGVGVVVDFGALGGGVTHACGSGSKASTAFTNAGVSLEQDARQSGFVCRVQGKPSAGHECLATNAYWALFISKQGGAWQYASQGVYTQPVKNGDSVAFVWQDSNARTAPGTAPQPLATPSAPTSAATSAPAKPKPSAKPKATKTPKPSAAASSSAPTPSSSVTASATSAPSSASSVPTPASSAPTSASSAPTQAGSAPTQATSTTIDQDVPAQTGLPGWVGPLIVVALIGIATAVLLVRKRAPKAP